MGGSRWAGAAAVAVVLLSVTACSSNVTGTASNRATAEAADPASASEPGPSEPATSTATSRPTSSASGAEESTAMIPTSLEPIQERLLQLGIDTGWGPTRREIRRAVRMVGHLSLPDLAGQVIVARYEGTAAPSTLVNRLHLGGVIVMGDNITSTSQVRASNQALQQSVTDAGRRWPAFIGVDQEGGVVERVKGTATRFPAFMSAGAGDNAAVTTEAARASGAELLGLGFTVDFAPDGDVTVGPSDPTIGSRSAGSRPRLVARQMNAAVDGYLSAGVVPVIKHFPGHGSVPQDSHLELPVQTRPLSVLRTHDLVPFVAGVAGGISAVMVAHIDVRAVDPGIPASLSHKVVTGLLRTEVGFQGLAVTDALDMGAVVQQYGSGGAAVRALRAGEDVLLMPPNPAAARDAIVAAVRNRSLSRARLEQAAARQVALLLHQKSLGRHGSRPGSGRQASYRLSRGAVTVVSGPCQGRLVGTAVRARGPAEAVAAFDAAAQHAGLATGSGSTVALIGYHGAARRADVVVSMDTPYVLGDSHGRTARIALYGDTPGAMRALVAVLLGKAPAPGTLPVRVANVPRTGC